MRNLVFVICLFISPMTFAQINPKISEAMVLLHNEDSAQSGCGLIIGQSRDSIYILTAAHVLYDDYTIQNNSVTLKVGTIEKKIMGHVVLIDSKFDYAIVAIKGKLKMAMVPTIANVDIEERVYFIKFIEGKKIIFPPVNTQAVTIESADPENHMFFVDMPAVEGGDSGSIYFCAQGIVGMVQNSGDTKFFDIAWLKQQILSNWKFKYWQLPEIKLYNK